MRRTFYTATTLLAVVAGVLSGCSKSDPVAPPAPDRMAVKTLSAPQNEARIELDQIEKLTFEWSACEVVSRSATAVYEVLFDLAGGDFSEPFCAVSSDDNGTATKAVISKNKLAEIARLVGAAPGESAELAWTVRTASPGGVLLADVSYGITVVRPEAPVVQPDPGVVTILTAPVEDTTVEIASAGDVAFAWKEAGTVDDTPLYYRLQFYPGEGEPAEPLFTVLSASEGLDPGVVLDKFTLDRIAEAAGAVLEGTAVLRWGVLTTMGEQEKCSEAMHTLSIVRDIKPVAEPGVVPTLSSPDDGQRFELARVQDGVLFKWDGVVVPDGQTAVYKLCFYRQPEAADEPVYSIASDAEGLGTQITLTAARMDEIAALAGVRPGEETTLVWGVSTTLNNLQKPSAQTNAIVVVRLPEVAFAPGDPLYIAGDGTEEGQPFRFVEADGGDSYYEIYTRIEAGTPFWFTSARQDQDMSDDPVTMFALDASATAFGQITDPQTQGKVVSRTAVYRLKLNLKDNSASVQTIDKVFHRYCNNANRDAEMSYMGDGVWKLSKHQVFISVPNFAPNGEDRYKFVFTVDGVNKAEHWGASPVSGQRPSLPAPEGYGDVHPVGTGTWGGAFKYPDALIDIAATGTNSPFYTDIVLYMNADRNEYTHELVNWYDSRLLPPPAPIDWEKAADSCTFTLVDQFFNKNGGFFWGSAGNVLSNSTNNYWQQAYPMHTLLFSHERIKNTDGSLAATYRDYFRKWVNANGHNYTAANQRKNGFWCAYTDDMAWITLVLLHMSEVVEPYDPSESARDYDLAKQIYDEYILESSRVIEDEKGWGLRWRLSSEDAGKDTRNACTNTPVMIIACKLYQITREQKYLDDALRLFDYCTYQMVGDNGAVAKSPNILTYTQGTWIEGCRLLYHITGDRKYLDRATVCATYTMSPSGACTTAAGILRGEGQSADQSNFKGGLIPYMVNYANDSSMPSDKREEVREFLVRNGEMLWRDNMDRSKYPKMFANFSWELPYTVEGNPGSLGAHGSGAALLEGITRLQQTP